MVDIGLLDTASGDAIVLTARQIVRIYATHGVSGIEWAYCRHPFPEFVHDAYMKYWEDVRLACEDTFVDWTMDKAAIVLGFVELTSKTSLKLYYQRASYFPAFQTGWPKIIAA